MAGQVLLTIGASSTDAMRVFLPKRFTQIFSDVDVDMINDGMIKINLIYHGTCEKTSVYLLSLEQVQQHYFTFQKKMRSHISMCQFISYHLITAQFIGLVIQKSWNSVTYVLQHHDKWRFLQKLLHEVLGEKRENKPILRPVDKCKSGWEFCCIQWWNDRISGKTRKCLFLHGPAGCGKSVCV